MDHLSEDFPPFFEFFAGNFRNEREAVAENFDEADVARFGVVDGIGCRVVVREVDGSGQQLRQTQRFCRSPDGFETEARVKLGQVGENSWMNFGW